MKKIEDNSPAELLKRLRQGYKQDIMFKMGGLDVPCRIMPADEQVQAISNAKLKLKIPTGHDKELLESIAVQKAVLMNGCTVEGIPHLPMKLLDKLSSDELSKLYDKYMNEIKFVDPEFEALSFTEVGELIDAVKKKEVTTKDLYTWQLAAIGKYCLNHLFQKVNVRGS